MKIIVIIMLLWAATDNPYLSLVNNPYFYYQILRWAVCGLTIYLAYLAYKNKQKVWIRVFTISAILFNPIAHMYFGREIRFVLNIIVAIILFVSIFPKKHLTNNLG